MEELVRTNLPEKVHLSGSDCFHLVLDKHARNHQSGDNVMRIVFYFDHDINTASFLSIIKKSPVVHWLSNIKLVPGSLLKIPYWKFKDQGREIFISEHLHPADHELPDILLNRDIPIDADFFAEFDIVRYPSGKSCFIISWNHILLDGRGIGMLVDHLNGLYTGHSHELSKLFPPLEKKPNIIRYIRNMYEVKRFIQTSSRRPIASVAEKNASSRQHFSNKLIRFSAEETKKIDANAFANGARFGANLFYLACCAHTVNALKQQRGNAGTMWMPIPYDGRLKGSFGPIVSNFVAYLFYRLPQEELQSVKQTVAAFNKQMAAQLKDEMPRKYNMLLQMMRHIPLGLYYFLISRTGEGSFASFLYSSTGNNFSKLDTFLGEPVQMLTIFPSSTFPPGLTFSFLRHKDALNINIAYSSDIISNIELDFIEAHLPKLLLSDY